LQVILMQKKLFCLGWILEKESENIQIQNHQGGKSNGNRKGTAATIVRKLVERFSLISQFLINQHSFDVDFAEHGCKMDVNVRFGKVRN